MSGVLFDGGGLNVATIATPSGPRLSFATSGPTARLDAGQAKYLAAMLAQWVADEERCEAEQAHDSGRSDFRSQREAARRKQRGMR